MQYPVMTLRLVLAALWVAAISSFPLSAGRYSRQQSSSLLFAKSRMPSASDLRELDEILNGEREWEKPEEVDWSQVPSNKPSKKTQPAAPSVPPRMPQVAAGSMAAKVLVPNANWRTATSSSASASSVVAEPPKARIPLTSTNPATPPPVTQRAKAREKKQQQEEVGDAWDTEDFSYDDFEAALWELEGPTSSGSQGGGAKHTEAPIMEHDGLLSGTIIDPAAWEVLVSALASTSNSNSNNAAEAPSISGGVRGANSATLSASKAGAPGIKGKPAAAVTPQAKGWDPRVSPNVGSSSSSWRFESIHKNQAELVVLFADPRRGNQEFDIILEQLGMLPQIHGTSSPANAAKGGDSSGKPLRIALAAVNTDDANDQRKFLKKNPLSFALLSDPTREFMDVCKARSGGRISSCLMLLEVKTSRVLKVFYEGSFDPFSAKDLIMDEIKEYRANPVAYVQSQIGIR